MFPSLYPVIKLCWVILDVYIYVHLKGNNQVTFRKCRNKLVHFSKSCHSNWPRPLWEATFCYQSDHCFGLIHGNSTIAIHCVQGRGATVEESLRQTLMDQTITLQKELFVFFSIICWGILHTLWVSFVRKIWQFVLWYGWMLNQTVMRLSLKLCLTDDPLWPQPRQINLVKRYIFPWHTFFCSGPKGLYVPADGPQLQPKAVVKAESWCSPQKQ